MAVKLEGAEDETLTVVNRMVRIGIPVMGHLGLTPQSVHRIGYRRQATDPISQERLRRQALCLEAAGCFALVRGTCARKPRPGTEWPTLDSGDRYRRRG